MKQGLDMCFLLDTAYMYVFAVTEIVIIFPDYVLNWSVIPLYAQTKVCGYYNTSLLCKFMNAVLEKNLCSGS